MDTVYEKLNYQLKSYPINGIYEIDDYLQYGEDIKLKNPDKIDLIDNIIDKCSHFSMLISEIITIEDRWSYRTITEKEKSYVNSLTEISEELRQKILNKQPCLEMSQNELISERTKLYELINQIPNPLPLESKNKNFWLRIYNILGLYFSMNFNESENFKKSFLADSIPEDISYEQINLCFNYILLTDVHCALEKVISLLKCCKLDGIKIHVMDYFLSNEAEICQKVMKLCFSPEPLFLGMTNNLESLNVFPEHIKNLFLIKIILDNNNGYWEDKIPYLDSPRYIDETNEYKSICNYDDLLTCLSYIFFKKYEHLNLFNNPVIKNYIESNTESLAKIKNKNISKILIKKYDDYLEEKENFINIHNEFLNSIKKSLSLNDSYHEHIIKYIIYDEKSEKNDFLMEQENKAFTKLNDFLENCKSKISMLFDEQIKEFEEIEELIKTDINYNFNMYPSEYHNQRFEIQKEISLLEKEIDLIRNSSEKILNNLR